MAMKPKRKPLECGFCKFYLKTDDTQGHCKRFPPVPMYAPVNPERPFVTIYPHVRSDMAACGEYKAA